MSFSVIREIDLSLRGSRRVGPVVKARDGSSL